jgi:hypothetical protein
LNTDYVQHNLVEAAEHLDRAIADVQNANEAGFEAWLVFVYRKLNCAWNSRNLSPDEAMDTNTLEQRCRFPLELADSVSD